MMVVRRADRFVAITNIAIAYPSRVRTKRGAHERINAQMRVRLHIAAMHSKADEMYDCDGMLKGEMINPVDLRMFSLFLIALQSIFFLFFSMCFELSL